MRLNGIEFPEPDALNVEKEHIGFAQRSINGTLNYAHIATKRIFTLQYSGLDVSTLRTLYGFLRQPATLELNDTAVYGVVDDIQEERLTPDGYYWKVTVKFVEA